jgi:hypothetical protein
MAPLSPNVNCWTVARLVSIGVLVILALQCLFTKYELDYLRQQVLKEIHTVRSGSGDSSSFLPPQRLQQQHAAAVSDRSDPPLVTPEMRNATVRVPRDVCRARRFDSRVRVTQKMRSRARRIFYIFFL